ncbi:hypothetical protein [uncultured Tateyamaria sp.]|uniref:hypothetical protein n=1 Tax=uncultured Tateyamaria sp. TaxID=455651 RepID=UPI002635E740|nr:hypothetical protein [uncultured Tateyamaria sp.]
MMFFPSKLEMRSAAIIGSIFTVVFGLFTLPMFFSDAVSVTVSNGFTGVTTERTAPGNELIAELLLITIVAGVFGCVFGIMSRRSRRMQLWKAKGTVRWWRIWGPSKLNAFERFVYRLDDDGMDI